MSNHTKLRWYRFTIARKIRNLEGDQLISELEGIIEDIINKKLDKIGLFKLQIRELESMISETKSKPKTKGRQYDPFEIPYSGDGRITLFGISNVGKSTLMNAITNTDVKTGGYLHTTRTAHAGTLEYQNVKIQIIDVPGFLDFKEDWATSKQILRVARTSDAILMVIDLSMDIMRQYNFLVKQLEDARMIENGETTYKFGIIATKGDLPNTKEKYQELAEITELPICPISIKEEGSLEKLKKTMFNQLEIIRIYSKKPGTKPNLDNPLVLPEGATVVDIARKIHTSFVDSFRYARVTGSSAEFESQQVGIDHVLADEDIVELIVTKR